VDSGGIDAKKDRPAFPLVQGRYFLRSPGIDSASLCSLAGRYETPIPTRFLATIDCSKIQALITVEQLLVNSLVKKPFLEIVSGPMHMEQFCVGFFKDTYSMQAIQAGICPLLFTVFLSALH
jgi:hypothetical protein